MEQKLIGNANELLDLFPKESEEYKKIFSSMWSSPETLATHVEGMTKGFCWSDGSAWADGTESFYGTSNMSAALKMARTGWPEGIAKADRLRNKILANKPITPKAVKYSIAGAYPNVPRAIAGDPLNMLNLELSGSKKRPVITLLSDMSAPWHVGVDTMSNRAAVIAALVDHIEAAGYSCDVIAFGLTHGGSTSSKVAVLAKTCSQPVDLARLAYCLGHPSLFRRLMFAEWEQDHFNNGLGYGLGSISGNMDMSSVNDKGVYLLPKDWDNFSTEEKAEKEGLTFLINELIKQGCPAFS